MTIHASVEVASRGFMDQYLDCLSLVERLHRLLGADRQRGLPAVNDDAPALGVHGADDALDAGLLVLATSVACGGPTEYVPPTATFSAAPDERLRIDYDYEKFKETFEQEMQRLNN